MIVWIFIAVPVLFVAFVASAIISGVRENSRIKRLPPEERAAAHAKSRAKYETLQWGTLSAQMVCPHCQSRGGVRTKPITRKAGVSGGKATAAILTGGVSLLAVGLSRKEASTEAHCSKCNATWHF